MNTKKKHKNRPKATNPAQTQKVEAEAKTENVVPKSDVKEEIPAVVAEIVTPVAIVEPTASVIESVEAVSETPKKPKRNKGKKKNQDKENIEEDVKEKEEATAIEPIDKTVEVNVSEKEEDGNKSSDAAYATPSARKKKNKKTPQGQSSTQLEPEKECLPSSLQEKSDNSAQVELEKESKVFLKVDEPETKSKKKNKKKKRNDSERSDKSDEVACTSAFQQFLPGEKSTEVKVIKSKETHSEENVTIANPAPEKLIVEDAPSREVLEECSTVKDKVVTETPKEENKNKKKNKKDKKHLHEEQPEEQKPEDKNEALLEVKQDLGLIELITGDIKEEPSSKPKAKIAKPVEKKRKSHEPTTESLSMSTEALKVMAEETLTPELPKEPEKIISKDEEISIKIISTGQPDTMNILEWKTKDKKRKKSPKPPPKTEPKTELIDILFPDFMQTKTEQKQTEIASETPKNKEKNSGGMQNVMFTMPEEPMIPLQKSERADEVPPLIDIEEPNAPDNKTGKKKKKTPKLPTSMEKPEKEEPKQLFTPEAHETKDVPKVAQPPQTESVTESSVTPLPDIEVRSVKADESEGSSCDIIPDVHFIRASSHQLLDDNNNMVIHEVRNVDDIKSNDPLIMPFIEGSGETPASTPDIASGIRITEGKTGKEEPTYLKSKMMEVNQDMEGLRLSLERSLAEFSAMEKSEEKAEEAYAPHKAECERTFAAVGKCGLKTPEEQMVSGQVNLPSELQKNVTETLKTEEKLAEVPPVYPARKDNKTKSKSKKKGKETASTTTTTSSTSTATQSETNTSSSDSKDKSKDKQEKQEKSEQKTESTKNKGKQQSDDPVHTETNNKVNEDTNKPMSDHSFADSLEQLDFAPIDNFEDALTSSIDDVNKTFEMIADEAALENQKTLAANKPEINVTAPTEDTDTKKGKNDEKINPVSQPKNFLGHNDIPAQSNRTDYKKEKNKTPNERQAKVKIKDAVNVEATKQSKESQTDARRKRIDKSEKETFSRVKNDNEEYVYKYSFRKVFLQSACHVCHKDLVQRVPCSFCNLVFYCSPKHKDEDWVQHQALCFAVSTIVHLKDQKHLYADAQNVRGQEYRLLRMQMIVSCEKVLKRRLVPWEQEAMLYPRMCGDAACREWRQGKLKDCEGCGQISYCVEHPSHLPKSHQRWCKSYTLYAKLVGYQQTRGRLEPRLPTKLMEQSQLAEKMNEVLAAMYEEKIDMNDIQYAALTQLATAPLTAAYCYQLWKNKSCSNGVHKTSSFTIHVVGAELQFEADALNKWEVFFLHLRPDVDELRVVLISPVLNPGELPLDLLGKVRLCDSCRDRKRRVVFSFQDKKNYSDYKSSEDFVSPDLVCAFNPSIQRSSVFNGKDPWPDAINCILKQKVPFIITGYTLTELRKDIARVKDRSEVDFRVISEPVFNNFASVRPDRNFISDDEMPLLFKNYCVSVLCGC